MEVDVGALKKEAEGEQQVLLNRMNAITQEVAKLEEEKQLALQQVLRLDGKIGLLKGLESGENGKDAKPSE